MTLSDDTIRSLSLSLPRHNADLWEARSAVIQKWIARNGNRFTASDLREFAELWNHKASLRTGVEFDDARSRHHIRQAARWANDLASALDAALNQHSA